jgi:hypothetical protein
MAEAILATKPTTPMTSAIAWYRVTVSRIGSAHAARREITRIR